MISSLRELIMNKENEVNKIKKLKEFFHLELLNREKNYNELFGNTPTIFNPKTSDKIPSVKEI